LLKRCKHCVIGGVNKNIRNEFVNKEENKDIFTDLESDMETNLEIDVGTYSESQLDTEHTTILTIKDILTIKLRLNK